jgi:hypothetical protein
MHQEPKHTLRVSSQELAAILAGLRKLQRTDSDDDTDAEREIATGGDSFAALDLQGIDKLCERINCVKS